MNKLSQQDLFMGEMTWRKINYVQKHNNSSIIFFEDNTSTFRQFWPRDRCRCCLVLYRRLLLLLLKKHKNLSRRPRIFLQKSGDVVVAFAYLYYYSTHTTFSSIIIMLWLSDYFRVCECRYFFQTRLRYLLRKCSFGIMPWKLSVDFTVVYYVNCKLKKYKYS